jgi:hypothetical protein
MGRRYPAILPTPTPALFIFTPLPTPIISVACFPPSDIRRRLKDYKECDSFLSTDAGVMWHMVTKGAHKYQFGDLGSILVIMDDEEITDEIKYSLDLGKTWYAVHSPLLNPHLVHVRLTYNFGISKTISRIGRQQKSECLMGHKVPCLCFR